MQHVVSFELKTSAVDHSDEIISQLSRLLFDDSGHATVELSAAEAYVLGASAYFHDAGMIVSAEEQLRLIASPEWAAWLAEKDRRQNWDAIDQLRAMGSPDDPHVRHFLADMRVRYMLAEYYRQRHHLRAIDVVRYGIRDLGHFGLSDPMLVESIGAVCVGHGLSRDELNDRRRFPFRRDIGGGDTINVRLLAILLRLADLLDMRSERACPLLLSAASPLPSSSLPHWKQYAAIFNKSVTPRRIVIDAQCPSQEVYGTLQDWCKWIVDEVTFAPTLLAESDRHSAWMPPHASMGTDDSTIQIQPAPGARFIPSRWHFDLDPEAIFERLIKDSYDSPLAFVRELLQNALDATRCRMYKEVADQAIVTSPNPANFPNMIRQRFPIIITLKHDTVYDSVTETSVPIQTLSVDDHGIGMTRDVIMTYFLQVGKSYYTTEEFRRSFHFAPTSRFGIGFLAVFAVSDHVVVETRALTSGPEQVTYKLTLTRPKNYLSTERGERALSGTSITMRLQTPLAQGMLTELVKSLCKRVEFPIEVHDLDHHSVINAETANDYIYEMQSPFSADETIGVKAFPLDIAGIDGELYVFYSCDSHGESWTSRSRFEAELENHPGAPAVPFVARLEAFRGITLGEGHSRRSNLIERLDYRDVESSPTVGRTHMRIGSERTSLELDRRMESILLEHLAQSARARGPTSFRYKQNLMKTVNYRDFWSTVPGTIRVGSQGAVALLTQAELVESERFGVIMFEWRRPRFFPGRRDDPREDKLAETSLRYPHYCILEADVDACEATYRSIVFHGRIPTVYETTPGGALILEWIAGAVPSANETTKGVVFVGDGLPADVMGFELHKTRPSVYESVLANLTHPYAKWAIDFADRLGAVERRAIMERLAEAIRYHKIESIEGYAKELARLRGFREPPPLSRVDWRGLL